MKENVAVEQAVTKCEYPLPPRVQEALGELVGVAREGLLALSVGVGLGVLAELIKRRSHRRRQPKGPSRPGSLGRAPRPPARRGHPRRA